MECAEWRYRAPADAQALAPDPLVSLRLAASGADRAPARRSPVTSEKFVEVSEVPDNPGPVVDAVGAAFVSALVWFFEGSAWAFRVAVAHGPLCAKFRAESTRRFARLEFPTRRQHLLKFVACVAEPPVTKMRQLDLTIAFDYRKPTIVRAAVAELRCRMDPETWAMLEALALEVCRSSAVDLETVHQVLRLGTDSAD